MARTHIIVDLTTGLQTSVPYTPQEEADADAAQAADQAAQAPIIADQQRRAAIRLNARTTAIIAALTTSNDTQLIAAVAARYPSLTGDGLKAVTDIALALAYIYHNGS